MGRDKVFDVNHPGDHLARLRNQIGIDLMGFRHNCDLIFHRFHPVTMKLEQTSDATAPTRNQKTSSAMVGQPSFRTSPRPRRPASFRAASQASALSERQNSTKASMSGP